MSAIGSLHHGQIAFERCANLNRQREQMSWCFSSAVTALSHPPQRMRLVNANRPRFLGIFFDRERSRWTESNSSSVTIGVCLPVCQVSLPFGYSYMP
jgi:hypothetical protein